VIVGQQADLRGFTDTVAGFLRHSGIVSPSPDHVAKPGHKIYPYPLRGMEITRPNQVWAMDMRRTSRLQFIWQRTVVLGVPAPGCWPIRVPAWKSERGSDTMTMTASVRAGEHREVHNEQMAHLTKIITDERDNHRDELRRAHEALIIAMNRKPESV
jgi:hypothetical protein